MSEMGRCTQGTGVVKPLDILTSSNPVDVGWVAVRSPFRRVNSWEGFACLTWEVAGNSTVYP